jgi:acyl-CoA synthetase (AMP-forming)/AMP-acid ligase II
LIGRKDRMMKDKQGEMVNPEMIESVISAIHPVSDVYVASYQDDLAVDQIAAMIEIRSASTDVEKLFSNIRTELSKRMPASHVPVFMMVVSEIPRGAGGKISGEAAKSRIIQEIKRRRQDGGSSNTI